MRVRSGVPQSVPIAVVNHKVAVVLHERGAICTTIGVTLPDGLSGTGEWVDLHPAPTNAW